MFRLNLGSSVTAFEIEGDADHVGSLSPSELIEEQWPTEVVDNFRRYQQRVAHSDRTPSGTIVSDPVTESLTASDENPPTTGED